LITTQEEPDVKSFVGYHIMNKVKVNLHTLCPSMKTGLEDKYVAHMLSHQSIGGFG
jgi:hypothetical protein